MKKIMKFAAVAAALLIGSSVFAGDKEDEARAKSFDRLIDIESCQKAVEGAVQMGGQTQSYQYVDSTGRTIQMNFAALCTAMPNYHEYLKERISNRGVIASYEAVANLLLMRSPISDARIQANAEETASPEFLEYAKTRGYPMTKEEAMNHYKFNYLFAWPIDSIKDPDQNILTPDKAATQSFTSALAKCYAFECSQDPKYGIGNKAFQEFLAALITKDFAQAKRVSEKYYMNFLQGDYVSEQDFVLRYIAGRITKYQNQ